MVESLGTPEEMLRGWRQQRMSTGSHPEPDEATHAAEGNVGELLWCSRRTADGNALQPAAKVTAQNHQ